MSAQEHFVVAAGSYLSVGKKSLSATRRLDLAAQVSAVDLGLKPGLLYDSNGACVAQLQRYLSSLQSLQLVSESLVALELDGNSLIINPSAVKSHLQGALADGRVAVVDVSASLGNPTVADSQTRWRRNFEDLKLMIEECDQVRKAEQPFCAGNKCEEWNLCTVFGLLLGYPIVYWFDQTRSFENCLSMTPLMVTTVSATWKPSGASHQSSLLSFSYPAALEDETRSKIEKWELQLREKFKQQHKFQDLSLSRSTVTLSSVCL